MNKFETLKKALGLNANPIGVKLISDFSFYFVFLIFYNHFRIILDFSLESSWLYGMIFGLISTLILVLIVDVLRVLYLIKSGKDL